MSNDTLVTGERADLLTTLAQHRQFLRATARDLDDEQATRRTTVSELTIAGVIKHVAAQEAHWADFIVAGPSPEDDFDAMTEEKLDQYGAEFRLRPGETWARVREPYAQGAAATDELVRTLPDLDASHPLPQAPWFAPGERWSARKVLLHVLAETAQHAGHADIIREALDGAKTMG